MPQALQRRARRETLGKVGDLGWSVQSKEPRRMFLAAGFSVAMSRISQVCFGKILSCPEKVCAAALIIVSPLLLYGLLGGFQYGC